ncbi:MAG: hypothetical protein KDB80_17105 [Planctomycetes bacterium]|nr:hypothetical protein [Planctomycetota bacterium]
MEEQVFPKSAVADLMEPLIVEARLHAENQRKRSPEEYARFVELRDEHVGTEAIPQYVFLDPESGEQLAYYTPPGPDPDALAADFVRILQQLAGN